MAGKKFDRDKPMMAAIPASAELAEARVWTFEADKYGLFNWQGGISFIRIISALQRHLTAIKGGEDIDPESGEYHAAYIRCNAGMLIDFMERGKSELDDRYKDMGDENVKL